MVLEDLFFTTHPPIFLPVHTRFYPPKWQVDGSFHKAMTTCQLSFTQCYLNIKQCKIQHILSPPGVVHWVTRLNGGLGEQ